MAQWDGAVARRVRRERPERWLARETLNSRNRGALGQTWPFRMRAMPLPASPPCARCQRLCHVRAYRFASPAPSPPPRRIPAAEGGRAKKLFEGKKPEMLAHRPSRIRHGVEAKWTRAAARQGVPVAWAARICNTTPIITQPPAACMLQGPRRSAPSIVNLGCVLP
jgi:hypothetical protein